MAMRDPMTKSPLLLHGPDSLVQSRNLYFPLRIVIAKDNKATLDGFRPLYNQFKTGEVATALKCRQFKLSFPADMKLQWGALGNGGAAKVQENFCYDDSSYECSSGDDDNDDVDMKAEEMSESGSSDRDINESIDDTSDDENN